MSDDKENCQCSYLFFEITNSSQSGPLNLRTVLGYYDYCVKLLIIEEIIYDELGLIMIFYGSYEL